MSLSQRRYLLDDEIKRVQGDDNVYFQPPEGYKMTGDPRTLYERDSGDTIFADNVPYRFMERYKLTVMYTDPDCDLAIRFIEHFPLCRMDRHFVSSNMYHDVLVLYW